VAFIDWPQDQSLSMLDELLASLQLGGMALNGDRVWLGKRTGLAFLRSVKAALDPANKFGGIK